MVSHIFYILCVKEEATKKTTSIRQPFYLNTKCVYLHAVKHYTLYTWIQKQIKEKEKQLLSSCKPVEGVKNKERTHPRRTWYFLQHYLTRRNTSSGLVFRFYNLLDACGVHMLQYWLHFSSDFHLVSFIWYVFEKDVLLISRASMWPARLNDRKCRGKRIGLRLQEETTWPLSHTSSKVHLSATCRGV